MSKASAEGGLKELRRRVKGMDLDGYRTAFKRQARHMRKRKYDRDTLRLERILIMRTMLERLGFDVEELYR